MPAGREQEWPTGNERYVPIDAKEFERLLDLAQTSRTAPRGGSAQLAKAEYQARLVGEQLLTGTALLDISHKSDDPALVSRAVQPGPQRRPLAGQADGAGQLGNRTGRPRCNGRGRGGPASAALVPAR